MVDRTLRNSFPVLACLPWLVHSHRIVDTFRLITKEGDDEQHDVMRKAGVNNSKYGNFETYLFDMPTCTKKEDGDTLASLAEVPEFTGQTTVQMGPNEMMCCCLKTTGVCRLSPVQRGLFNRYPTCTSLHGRGYESYNAEGFEQKCFVQPKNLCDAAASFKPIVQKCAAGSPWTNVLKVGGGSPEEVAKVLTDQLNKRLADPIPSIRQARQGFCGPASVLILFAVAYPLDYLDMVESLFCSGEWRGPQGLNIDSSLSLLAKWKKMWNSEGAQDNILEFDLTHDLIRIKAVDWMTMGSFRNVYDIKFGQIKLGSVGAGILWQGSTTDMIELWLNGLFSNFEKVFDTAPGFSDLWSTGRKVPEIDRWKVLTDAVAATPFVFAVLRMQIAEDIDVFNEKQKVTLNEIIVRDGFTNHYVTLVAVEKQDCITWTWGYFLTFDCDDLRKRTEQGVLTDLSAGDQERLLHFEGSARKSINKNRYGGWNQLATGTVSAQSSEFW